LTEIVIDVNILLAIAALIFPITLITGRHFWNKGKCFVSMKAAIEQLQRHDVGATDEHDGYNDRLTAIEGRQQKNEIYLKLLLDHNGIKYD
jgi:hypothetical protein